MADAEKDTSLEEIIKDEMSKETPDNQEQEPSSESTEAKEPELSQEDKELQDLDNDKDFQEALEQQAKEMGVEKLSFGQTKRFRSVYRGKKEAERKIEELQSQLDSQPEPSPQEVDLKELAEKQGIKLTPAEEKKMATLQSMLENVEKPEDRKWLQNFASALKEELKQEQSQKYDQPMNQMAQLLREYELDRSETRARQYIDQINDKHGLAIDFDKDVDPELTRMIRSNKNLDARNTDLYQLTREFMAERGIEFGKKLSVKEQQQLNNDKKKAGMETSGSTASSLPKVDDSKLTAKEIFADEMKKAGLTAF